MSHHTVLLVDDEPDILEALRDVLTDEGYAVAVATNGEEALKVLARIAPPCLMIVDLLMPVMDGVELLERIQRDETLSKVPVVVLSASSTVKPPAGTKIYRKPIGVTQLLQVVSEYCGLVSPRA